MCNTAHEVDVRTSWNSGSARKRQYAVRKSTIQRLRKGMGNQVDDFEPDVSKVERRKRTRRSDYEEQAE